MDPEPPPIPAKKSSTGLYIAVALASLVGLAVFGFVAFYVVKGVKQAQATRQQLAAFEKDNTASLREAVNGQDAIAGSSERLQSAQQKLAAITENMGGTDKAVMLAGQEVMAEVQPPLKAYQTAYAELMQSKSFAAEGLHSLADIEQRRVKVQAFADANQQLTTVFAALGDHFRAGMKARGISDTRSEVEVKAFLRSSHADLVALIREDDRQLGLRMLEVLDFYQESWGRWKVNDGGQVLFSTTPDLERYNKLVQEIQAIGKHQGEMQQKMLTQRESETTK